MRAVAGILNNNGMVLIVRYKNPIREEYQWFFPMVKLDEGVSPKKEIKEYFKEKFNLDVDITGDVIKFEPSYDPETIIYIYPLKISGGFLKSSGDFEIVKWINPKEVPKYFSARLTYNISKFLDLE